MAEISQARVRRLFNYDSSTGILSWCKRPISDFADEPHSRTWNTRYAGKPAGSYSVILHSLITAIDGKSFKVHRLIWLWNYGEWPTNQIDHINGDGRDNRLENLRDVTNAENHRNMPVSRNSKSGIIGVRLHADGAWIAEIKVGDKYMNLGSFKDIRMAAVARKAAEKVLGYHENHGRPSDIANRRTGA